MKRKTGQFEVQADDGQRFTIVEYQNFIDVGTKDDPYITDLGLKKLRTSDDRSVYDNDDGTDGIGSLGLTVRRIA